MEEKMATCKFCHRKFKSEQSVRAHLKGCGPYFESKRSAALGKEPEAGSIPSVQPTPSAASDCAAPLRNFQQAILEFSVKQEAPKTQPQLRRSILQAVKSQVVDRYRSSSGTVTSEMRGNAKMSIERRLASVPIDELPFDEVCELAAAIRDRLYALSFTSELQKAEQKQAEKELRDQKQSEEMAAVRRAARRKAILVEQAIAQAAARCEANKIVGRNRLPVLVTIETQLAELLTGHEPISEAYAIVQTVIDARFVQAEATQEAAKAKANDKWYEDVAGLLVLGIFLAATLLAPRYPVQALVILNWIEQTFGLNRTTQADAPKQEQSETASPTPNMESRPRSRRRRKESLSPWTNSVRGEWHAD